MCASQRSVAADGPCMSGKRESHQHGSAGGNSLQGLLHQPLALRVQRARRLARTKESFPVSVWEAIIGRTRHPKDLPELGTCMRRKQTSVQGWQESPRQVAAHEGCTAAPAQWRCAASGRRTAARPARRLLCHTPGEHQGLHVADVHNCVLLNPQYCIYQMVVRRLVTCCHLLLRAWGYGRCGCMVLHLPESSWYALALSFAPASCCAAACSACSSAHASHAAHLREG